MLAAGCTFVLGALTSTEVASAATAGSSAVSLFAVGLGGTGELKDYTLPGVLLDEGIHGIHGDTSGVGQVGVVTIEVTILQRLPPGVPGALHLLEGNVASGGHIPLGEALVHAEAEPVHRDHLIGSLEGAPYRPGVHRVDVLARKILPESRCLDLPAGGQAGVRDWRPVFRSDEAHGKCMAREDPFHGVPLHVNRPYM